VDLARIVSPPFSSQSNWNLVAWFYSRNDIRKCTFFPDLKQGFGRAVCLSFFSFVHLFVNR
jgi:hypothetical protein